MSVTQTNSASLRPTKYLSRILATTAEADFLDGTAQFSMSQNTPMGAGAHGTGGVSGTTMDGEEQIISGDTFCNTGVPVQLFIC